MRGLGGNLGGGGVPIPKHLYGLRMGQECYFCLFTFIHTLLLQIQFIGLQANPSWTYLTKVF